MLLKATKVDGVYDSDPVKNKGARRFDTVSFDQVLADNPGQLEQYRAGKDKLFGFFVGQVMKATRGKANPAEVNKLLKESLDG